MRLVSMAERFGCVVVEDDAYGLLQYEGPTRALRAFGESAVIHVGSFSKILAPAVRIGWIIAPEWLHQKLDIAKEAMDINTGTFTQHIVVSMLETMDVMAHIESLQLEYRRRRDAMLQALQRTSRRKRSGAYLRRGCSSG